MKPDAYSDRFCAAIDFTTRAFQKKVRKGNGVPYITHLLAVTSLVGEAGGDEDQLIAALLHDYLEDIDGSRVEDISQPFGQRVADMVLALSDTTVRPKPPWMDRKTRFLARIRDEAGDVKLICTADKLHNCSTLVRDADKRGDAAFAYFNASKADTIWYYEQVGTALRAGWSHWLLDEFDACVASLIRFK